VKVAVMQPYLFPYIGYFQLINSVDKFVIYDDVNYIKNGYVNRNNIIGPQGIQRITWAVEGASSFKKINELTYSDNTKKLLKTIKQNYAKAPYFSAVYPLLETVFLASERNVARTNCASIRTIFTYLELNKDIFFSSELDFDRSLKPADKLVEMCQNFEAGTYINSPGGKALYSKKYFSEHGIELKFIVPAVAKYKQMGADFLPNLSIIDIMMYCDKDEIIEMLNGYELE